MLRKRNDGQLEHRDTSKGEEQLLADKKSLKAAVAAGSCTLSEWKPFSAITQKAMQAHRR
jgi:hypothetical protein